MALLQLFAAAHTFLFLLHIALESKFGLPHDLEKVSHNLFSSTVSQTIASLAVFLYYGCHMGIMNVLSTLNVNYIDLD